jgi:hypothetical protein
VTRHLRFRREYIPSGKLGVTKISIGIVQFAADVCSDMKGRRSRATDNDPQWKA